MLKMNDEEVEIFYKPGQDTWANICDELEDQYATLLFTKMNVYGFIRKISSLEDVIQANNFIRTWQDIS
jgi:hypothetical protein